MEYIFQLQLSILLILLTNGMVRPIAGQTAGDDHSQIPLNPAQEAAYLRIIYNDSSQAFFRNHECPDGIWQENVKTNPTVSCVCVKGIYAVSSSLCDETFQILTGNEHCYSLDRFKPRKFFPLLGKLGFKSRSTTVFRQDGPFFARLVSPAPNNRFGDTAKYILRVNDPTTVSVFQNDGESAYGLKCLAGQNVDGKSADDLEKKPVIQIAELPNCGNEFWGEQDWCSGAGNINYNWKLDIGKSWSQNTKSGKSGVEYKGQCGGAPSLDPPPDAVDNTKLVKSWPVCDAITDTKYRQSGNEYRAKNPFVLYKGNISNPFGGKANWHTEAEHQVTANEVTKRVAKDLLAFSLSGKKLPTVNLTEYKFLQHSKVIFMKVCPAEDIPAPAMNFIIRAFRLLLIEALKISNIKDIVDEGLRKSIEQTLTDCEAKATAIKFFGNCSNQADVVETLDASSNKANLSLYYNNRTDQNRTTPNNINFDTSDLSYPIELVWKLMAHTHYYCADYFKSGYEHSAFQAKVEALLTIPPLLFQWRHPGASLQVYQVLMSRFDLVDLAQKIDRCLAHAQAISPYKEWINRPADFISLIPKSRKKRYHFSNNFWDNRAFCLQSNEEIRTQVTTYHEGLCAKTPVYYKNND